MLFNSTSFYVFLIVILCLYYSPTSWKVKKLILLLGSYFFYAAWNPTFIVLLWISTFIDWQVAERIYVLPQVKQKQRKFLLMLSLLANLGVLGYFKYGTFVVTNATGILHILGFTYKPFVLDIILPVGISFYTFQSLSYSLDVYFHRIKPAESLLDFALYVSFFPQLVAGPIVRSQDFLPQCAKERRATPNEFGWGAFLLTYGLFQKMILADVLMAPIVEKVFSSRVAHNFLNDWTGILAFSMQIYFDFNGYTNCAIGVALLLGFHLPRNFHFPYAASSFSDFWRRWHISLSTWLRDYLYIPLGGSRSGFSRTNVNLIITMLLGGLWHGASWNFVIWGGLHGFYLIAERLYYHIYPKNFVAKTEESIGKSFVIFLIISLTWVFFRSKDLHTSWEIFKGLLTFDLSGNSLKPPHFVGVSFMALLLFKKHWQNRKTYLETIFAEKSQIAVGFLWICMLVVIIYSQGGSGNAFLYFQF
ncbi:MAG: MBOAT family O-acyltransferase [Spirochaetota bacterium]